VTVDLASYLVRYSGIVFRAHHPNWAFSPVSGEGAKKHGGRFNPKGMSALYTAETLDVAIRETQQGFAYKGFQPTTICSYKVDCESVVDLTDAKVLAALSIKKDVLECPWESLMMRGERVPSHELAIELSRAGVTAIRVPSFAVGANPADHNIIFWSWSDNLPHQVQVIDSEKRLTRP